MTERLYSSHDGYADYADLPTLRAAAVTATAIVAARAAPSGYASLDVGGKLTLAELPITRGTATLVAGTVVVATAAVTASSIIQLTAQSFGGTPGLIQVSARTPGASFTITSLNVLDTSLIGWLLMEP